MYRTATVGFVLFVVSLGYPSSIFARQPVIEERAVQHVIGDPTHDIYADAQSVGDPSFSGIAVYGELKDADEVDVYMAYAAETTTVDIELLVPAKARYRYFFPAIIIAGPDVPEYTYERLAIDIPLTYYAQLLNTDAAEDREIIIDFGHMHRLYRGPKLSMQLLAQKPYYFIVHNPIDRPGRYVIHIGDNVNYTGSIRDTFVDINPNSIALASSTGRGYAEASEPTAYEQSLFAQPRTPFQTLDTRLKLWLDMLYFFLAYRPGTLL